MENNEYDAQVASMTPQEQAYTYENVLYQVNRHPKIIMGIIGMASIMTQMTLISGLHMAQNPAEIVDMVGLSVAIPTVSAIIGKILSEQNKSNLKLLDALEKARSVDDETPKEIDEVLEEKGRSL